MVISSPKTILILTLPNYLVRGVKMKKDTTWSEYWENEGVSGEVFVNAKGKKHALLSQYWATYLSQIKKNAKIIDLACGGGSIFADIEMSNKVELYAADISAQALSHLNKRLPQVQTIVCSVDNVPLEDATFDLVVSQFGIEYSGKSAFIEAARLMAKESQLVILCHIEDGFIDEKNKMEIEGINLLQTTDFIEKAMAVTTAFFTDNPDLFNSNFERFISIEPLIADWVKNYDKGFVAHCYFGFRKMFERKEHYQLNDFTDWLTAMKGESENMLIRLGEMRRAAQSELQIKEIRQALTENGLSNIHFEPFTLPGQALPLAWSIVGCKA